MKIGIISDTHDNVEAVERAVERFEAEGIEVVLHCGDFIAPLIVPLFGGFELHGVLGNNDGEVEGLLSAFDALERDSQLHGRFASLELDNCKIAMLHGESMAEVRSIAASGHFDVVCYGHHHARKLEDVGDTMLVNPGAHFPQTPADHRTLAILETEETSISFLELA